MLTPEKRAEVYATTKARADAKAEEKAAVAATEVKVAAEQAQGQVDAELEVGVVMLDAEPVIRIITSAEFRERMDVEAHAVKRK